MIIGNFPHSKINDRVLHVDKQNETFAKIFSRYDITVSTGIVNVSDFHSEMDALKKLNSNYDFYLSPTLTKPEMPRPDHYAYIFRKDLVTVDDYVRDLSVGALSARVKVISTGHEFVLSIVHLAGPLAVKELELLPATCESIRTYYKLENILIAGDFNTVTHYMKEEQYNKLTVTKDPLYKWFIEWSEDTLITTLANGAINRFLAVGDTKNWVDSASIFNTKEVYKLTDEEALGMSAMFPTELKVNFPVRKV